MSESGKTHFSDRIRTRIWEEIADADNPYLARGARCHGYALSDLIAERSLADVIFLLIRGELPKRRQARLFERFLIAFCNPGPRNAATRAVMNAAASKTHVANLLPIGLAILGGAHGGAAEVESATRFIGSNLDKDPVACAEERLAGVVEQSSAQGDIRIAPGFGTLYGGIDPFAIRLFEDVSRGDSENRAMLWAKRFAARLNAVGSGWLPTGVAAAICVELGFPGRTAASLLQLAAAPGLVAHGLEMAGRGVEAMPFVPDERYALLDDARTPGDPE